LGVSCKRVWGVLGVVSLRVRAVWERLHFPWGIPGGRSMMMMMMMVQAAAIDPSKNRDRKSHRPNTDGHNTPTPTHTQSSTTGAAWASFPQPGRVSVLVLVDACVLCAGCPMPSTDLIEPPPHTQHTPHQTTTGIRPRTSRWLGGSGSGSLRRRASVVLGAKDVPDQEREEMETLNPLMEDPEVGRRECGWVGGWAGGCV
jgi:hypothetical protein